MGQRRAGVLVSRLVQCDARRRDVRDRAGRVVTDARLVDERLRSLSAVRCLGPCPLLGGHERELCLCEVQLLDGAGRLPALDRCRQVVLRPFGGAEQGM